MAGLPQEGQSFGRYDIGRRIGRGGMGVVYAAVQKGLGREVALKVLSADYADNEEYRHRFLREAEVLARLDSPHIIQVHDAGEQDGWLYIATQLVPDGDLHAMLKQFGPMPIGLALDVTGQVADGIGAAHRAGIVHRDVKPSNVLLRKLGEGKMQAYVCDLGISRVLDAQHTKTQGVIGTFAYMAPERHEGHEATEASDIYALGCLLWATLSGAAPFVGTDSQVLLGHLNGPIPQLERPDAIGSRINEVLRRSMAKSPADRYPTAEDFAGSCQAIVDALVGKPEIAGAEAATSIPGGPPSAGDVVQPSSHAQQLSGPQSQHQSGPQQFAAQQSYQQGPPGPAPSDDQQWSGQQQSKKSSTKLIVGIVMAVVLIAGGITALVLTLGGDDEPGTAADDKSSQSESSENESEPTDAESESTGPTDGDSSESTDADIQADVSSSPMNAQVSEFCSAFRDFNFNPVYVEGRKTIGNLIEVGSPAEFDSTERAGFVRFVEVVQDSPTEDEFLAAFTAFDSTEKDQVDKFHKYTQAEC